MKIKLLFNKVLILLFCYCPLFSLGQTIDNSTFDTNIGTFWNDGGGDCAWGNNYGFPFTTNPSIRLRDNSGVASSMTTNNIDLSSYSSIRITFDFEGVGMNNGHDFWLQISQNGGGTYTTIEDFNFTSPYTNNTDYQHSEIVNASDYGGLFATNSRFRIRCDSAGNGDIVYVDNVHIEVYTPGPEIDITGLGVSIIGDGSNTPIITDDTDFGTVQAISETVIKTFTIQNLGSTTLTLGTVSLTGSADFTISSAPSTSIAAGSSTTIQISFNTLSAGLETTQLSIASDDTDENPYLINLSATGTQAFYDSDGDGVYDDVDIDDDNDGIIDSLEESNCSSSLISNTVNYKFLNETFGTGGRTTINTSYAATTTYCYEDGTVGTNTVACPSLSGTSLHDGEYTVYNTITNNNGTTEGINVDIASWAEDYWYEGEDHTPGDTDGRMAIFNASYDPGVFYTANITGSLPNVPITYDFWVINIDRTDAPGIATRLRPNVLVEFFDTSGNLLINQATGLPASISTGDIPPTTVGNTAGDWYNFTADLTFNVSQFEVVFTNNETGGLGNDLALDDIKIEQTLCDTDNDGIADLFDLDSDDDGIPDVVEVQLDALNNGAGVIDASIGWIDTNLNGLHDAAEGHTIPDTDGDGVDDYLDLDSDNDTIFDVDESGAGNTSKVIGYINGDGDINGDGTGNTDETEAFREKDTDGDGIVEYYGDGILDIFEHFDGVYGNTNQGDPVDTDGDGLPDYLDPTTFGIHDISTTLYASLDADNDGVIDDTNDIDKDGILDLFDTDETYYGSPRDLNRSLYVQFDGRNDYAQDISLLSGLGGSTIMAWVNIDNLFSSQGFVVGQDNFNLKIDNSRNVVATANGSSITNSSALNTSQWVHIAAIYNNGSNTFKLYINGEEVATTTAPSVLNADASLVTLGKNPSSDTEYFYGGIEEVKIFDIAITELQLQKMVYQKVEDNGQIRGEIIPIDIDVSWANLIRYYRMDAYKDDIIDNYATGTIDVAPGNFLQCFNVKEIVVETAPLPFITEFVALNYDIGVAVSQNNDVRGDDVKDYDWSITHIKHDINLDIDHSDLGLLVDNGTTVNLNNDTKLNNDWYLLLNGFIDLNGESQLVQTAESILDVASLGYIERDQQGTANSFTYNYWSSPVGLIGAGSNNNSFSLSDVLRDGTNPLAPVALDFDASGTDYFYADGVASTPRKIATYWLWKFINKGNAYANWEWVGSTNNLNVADGFTMKGTSGSGSLDMSVEYQNNTFRGKPNNAPTGSDIVHTTFGIPADPINPYISLTGNPFPSAIDANAFIDDNAISTSQVIYFWEHWGGGSHVLKEYQGGYSTYTKAGSTPTPTLATSHPDISQVGSGSILPGQYIPVAQGFYVYSSATGGDVIFKNSQRVFEIENGNSDSNFSRSAPIERIRLGFDSPDHYHRQVMVAFMPEATDTIDKGYDAEAIQVLSNDSFLRYGDKNYVIHAFESFDEEREIPLVVIIDEEENGGMQKFMIDSLENISAEKNIFIKDKIKNITHDLRQSNYEINLPSGTHVDRFSLVFRSQSLSVEDELNLNKFISVYMNNSSSEIQIRNQSNSNIEEVTLYNSIGQKVKFWNNNNLVSELNLPVQNLSTGIYLVTIDSDNGKMTKKIVVE